MSHATRIIRLARHACTFMLHFAHGSLVMVGLVAMAIMGAQYLEHGSLYIPGGAGITEAQASVPEEQDAAAPKAAKAPVLTPDMKRVRDYLSRRYRVSSVALSPLLARAETAGEDTGLDPMLIVAVIAVESSFNPLAESAVGAQGLMQVIPRFHMDKIGDGKGPGALFDPLTNIRVGALVLKEGLDRYGSLRAALQYYGGALDDPHAGYAHKVLAMKARLLAAAGHHTGA